jgi:hypothetical protein
MTRTHKQFFSAFLAGLSLPIRVSGLRALACVSIFESSEGNEKWNNPLACTLYWPNATPYNTFGDDQHVWRYATFADGVHATARLFSGPHWAPVRAAINANTKRGPILDAFTAAYTWADFDFRKAGFNHTDQLDARLAHILYGPGD